MSETLTPTILAVDDQAQNLDLLTQLLSRKGFVVIPATSGTEAMVMLERYDIDLILMDVNMPNRSGYEVCTDIKAIERYINIPVIFVSAIDDSNVKMKAFAAGGVDYVTRPYQIRELMARIEAHLKANLRREAINRQQEQQIEDLQEINQLKDDILYMVSHDLKNPIGVIVMYVDLLRRRDPDYWSQHSIADDYLTQVKVTAQRMAGFLSDVLDVMRIDERRTLALVPTPLADILNQSISEAISLALAKDITITYTPPDAAVMLAVMPQLFQQSIINLLSNAVKYSDEHSEISLTITLEEAQVAITVEDHGLGIPANALPHLFERFYRVDSAEHRARPGSGLGLAIVKTIIDQHNGTIAVESTVGTGSRFTVRLPRLPSGEIKPDEA